MPSQADKKMLVWSNDLATGHDAIDLHHREFVERANALVSAHDADMLGQLHAFEVHAIAHFGDEDRLMQEQPYPSAGCHFDEHKAVLASIAEVIPLVAAGNVGIGRNLAAELIRWFPEHTEEMDKGFVRWRTRQSLGGSPVVLHRTRPSTQSASGA